jgi:probable rRNA maturation factor
VTPDQIRIDIHIDDPSAAAVDAGVLRQTARAVLEAAGVRAPAELSIVLVTDDQIRELNRIYRDVDAYTDVLAFGDEGGDGFVTAPGAPRYLGDVIVSFRRAAGQARRAGHTTEAEVQLLVVHGVLHLLGYDHAEEDDKAQMWAAQTSILSELQVPVKDPTPGEED